jgi:hypothetical protein
MKHISTLIVRTFVLTSLLLLVNCQKDDSFNLKEHHLEEKSPKRVFTINPYDIPEILSFIANKQKGFIPKLEPKLNPQQRSINPTNPFGTIDTSVIKALENLDGNRVYTFKINTYQPHDTTIYNLIVITDAFGNIENTYIKGYTFANDKLKIDNTYTGHMIKYNLSGVILKSYEYENGIAKQPCVECCDNCDQEIGNGTDSIQEGNTDFDDVTSNNSTNNQSSSSTGGGSTSGDSAGSSGSTGTGGGIPWGPQHISWLCNWRYELHPRPDQCNRPDAGGTWIASVRSVNNQILPCCDDDTAVIQIVDEDDCNELNALSNDPEFIGIMNDLNTKSTTLDKEVGYIQKEDTTTTSGYSYDYTEESEEANNQMNLNIPYPSTLKGYFHTHDDEEQHSPVFSLDDLNALFELFNPSFNANGVCTFNNMYNIEEDFTMILITAHGTKLALKFDSNGREKLRQFGEKYFGDWHTDLSELINIGIEPETDRDIITKKFENMIKEKFDVEKKKQRFAKFLDKMDFGMSLYQATDNTFTQWEKVNKNGTTTPCND